MHLFDDLCAGKEIVVRGSTYEVIMPPTPLGQTMGVCWKETPKAFHWQLRRRVGSPSLFLLKVMKSDARTKRLSDLQGKLQARYSNVAGFSLDQRMCLTRDTDAEILRQLPELEYAILMPWFSWRTWAELVQEISHKPTEYTWQHAQRLSYATAQTLCAMEFNGHAHTDIAGSNVLYEDGFQRIALADLEGFYMPDLPSPTTTSQGTPGYQHHETKRNGQSSSSGDRFAGAILLTEMLTLWSPSIQAILPRGVTTLFQQDELQEVKGDGHRQLVYATLQHFSNSGLAELFQRAWESSQLGTCPPLGKWYDAIRAIQGIQPSRLSYTTGSPQSGQTGFQPNSSQTGSPQSGQTGFQPSPPQTGGPQFGQTGSQPSPPQIGSPSPAPRPDISSADSESKRIIDRLRGRRRLLLALGAGGVGAAVLGLIGWVIFGAGSGTVNGTPTPSPATLTPIPPPTPTPTPTPHVASWTGNPSGLTSSLAPALIVWQQTLYMYYVDTTPNQGNSLTVVPTDNLNSPVQIASHASSHPPALVDQGSQLMMAYVANNSSNTLLTATSTDGLTWGGETTLNQSSATAPALASVNSTTYMAFVSNDGNHVILISSDTDGFNSNQPTTFNSDLAPALLASQDGQTLIMAFVDTQRNNDILITTSTDGSTWSPTQPTHQTASATPALAYLGTILYLVFSANDGSGTLQFISSQDLTNWSLAQNEGEASPGAPSVAPWNQGLTLAYMNSSDSLQVATSQE